MKLEEKLQMLRKQNGYSQEQLAYDGRWSWSFAPNSLHRH